MVTSWKCAVILMAAMNIYTTSAARKLGKKEDRSKMSEKIPLPTALDKKLLERRAQDTMETTAEDDFINNLMEMTNFRRSANQPATPLEQKHIQKRRTKVKRMLPDKPRPFGLDSNLLGPDHPMRIMRTHEATNTTLCHRVRSVPDKLRLDENFYIGIDPFYTKYTEAYGIPIIGSDDVTEHGLKRACYVVTMMLASRYDIRNAFYNFYGRIALIGDNEQQTSLPEYSTWDPLYWNRRARGLGATVYLPVTSAGDDNQRCKAGERYFDQDILIHEMGHAIELLAAHFVIPQFKSRLEYLFEQNVKLRGMWEGTYAATNPREYLAVATQFYFNSFRGTSYRNFGIVNRDTLRYYDPDITDILDELYPCVTRNPFVHRCQWKACDLSSFKLFLEPKYIARSGCQSIADNDNKQTLDECAFYACYHQANVFQMKGTYCEVLRCEKTKTYADVKIIQGEVSYAIYTAIDLPQPDVKEIEDPFKQGCTKHLQYSVRCAPIPLEERELYGDPTTMSKFHCKQMHYCYDKDTNECFKPLQDCVDKSLECPDMELKGECERNPGFMYRHCPFSCNVCEFRKTLPPGLLLEMCQDRNIYCDDWAKSGQCEINPRYMLNSCPIVCGECTPDVSLVGL